MRGALLMHSPKTIVAIGGISIIAVLFVALAALALIAKLVQFGQALAGRPSRTRSPDSRAG
jgi:hypothetical protein